MSIIRRLLGLERWESYGEQQINLRIAQASSRDVRAALTGALETAASIIGPGHHRRGRDRHGTPDALCAP